MERGSILWRTITPRLRGAEASLSLTRYLRLFSRAAARRTQTSFGRKPGPLKAPSNGPPSDPPGGRPNFVFTRRGGCRAKRPHHKKFDRHSNEHYHRPKHAQLLVEGFI